SQASHITSGRCSVRSCRAPARTAASPRSTSSLIARTAGLPDSRYHSSNVVIGTSKSDVFPLSTRWLLPASAALTKYVVPVLSPTAVSGWCHHLLQLFAIEPRKHHKGGS